MKAGFAVDDLFIESVRMREIAISIRVLSKIRLKLPVFALEINYFKED